ncbi:MAG TPA: metalloregulator ArsR/SmtB family transcription factor [Steroidobacteraceae bacterium]|nr:metalloregulator ArsR/SmtB family transcription factor [Steroidobacteraceae bacterium]
MPSRSSTLVAWLRAAGEPSRLRLLALCRQGDLSVQDLAEGLGQSEPRISRHLKILCEAGLVGRLRQGQWVHYRLATDTAAAGFVQGLLGQLDSDDPQIARDRTRARNRSPAPDGHGKSGESRLGRALEDFIDAAPSDASNVPVTINKGGSPSLTITSRAVLVVGVQHLELLEAAARLGQRLTVIAHTRRAAQAARAFVERRGIACRVLVATSLTTLREDGSLAGERFDSVVADHLAAAESAGLSQDLKAASQMLAPDGRLWMFERYEALEGAGERVVEHPLARIRRLLGELGLRCDRLSPIEADGEHVLAAVAVRSAVTSREAVSAA